MPIRNFLRSGTGTVTVPSAPAFCIAMRLPRRRTSKKPKDARNRQASRPDRTRSFANRDLDMSRKDFAAQALADLFDVGRLETQGQRFGKIAACLVNGDSLTGDANFRARGRISLVLAFNDRGQPPVLAISPRLIVQTFRSQQSTPAWSTRPWTKRFRSRAYHD
ncbi:MAG: hypothetical protein OXI87_19245 [Albidovulum sp.]|nr:hypothetical protein [Albidovulum sp.]